MADVIKPVHTLYFCCDFRCDFLLLMDVNEWMSYECLDEGTSVRHILRAFITYLLVHMRQRKKIAPEIASNRPHTHAVA
jgi:hypothetical protein